MSTHPISLDNATFAEFINSADKPVLVDFWAEWCQPCKAIAPLVDKLATDHADRILVAKLDVDANPEIAAEYQIMGIPTLLVFKNGKEVKRLRGARSEEALLSDVAEFISES